MEGQERERERCRMEKKRKEEGRAGLWLLLCRNVNTLQRSQKTMTPRGEEGVHGVCSCCVFVVCVCVCVCVCVHVLLCGWVQQQHYGERKENDGGEMRERERERERADPGKIGDMRFLS